MGRWLCVLGVLAMCGLFPDSSAGQEAEESEESEPVVMSADELVVDDVLNIVIARGNVEVSRSGRLLTADTVTYNPRNGVVTASGNVVIVETTGDVTFVEYAELDTELAEGFVEGIGLLFADDSRLAADRGVRRGPITEVGRAVYSPCALCEDNPDRAPLWQLRAARVIHDAENKDVIYKDAFLDFFGVPVFYTPHFSHPDPSVERRSGFLVPRVGSTSNLGPFARAFYFWSIGADKDATFELGGTRDAGFIFGAEYRQRFENGEILLDGSFNQSDRPDETEPGGEKQDDWRGHIFASGEFHLNDNWRAGADIRRSSDDTYLEQFEITRDKVLRSRAYAEGFYGLSYAAAEAYAYQDVRRPRIDQPLILPDLSFNHVSEPGGLLNGQWFANGGALNLMREDEPEIRVTPTEGVDTRRFSLETGWQTEFKTDFGLLTDFRTAVRGDLYWSDKLPTAEDPNVTEDDVVEFRAFPRATVTARYPLMRQQGTIQQLVEPIVAFTAAPNQGDVDKIPNNDSVDVEFDEINLFSDSRFPGIDRVEGGYRVTYGLRLGVFGFGGGSTSLFAGQSYSFDSDNNFPDGSGLERQQSDWVGRLTMTPTQFFNLDYRFRFDAKSLEGRRQEVSLVAGPDLFRVGATYTFVDEVAGTVTGEDVEELTAGLSSRFADNWYASGSFRRDLVEDESREFKLGLAYVDECFTFGVEFRRRFASERESASGDAVFLIINLRNLGDLPFSVKGGSLFN